MTCRSPAGPPRTPAWPLPFRRILVPSLTPGGILTLIWLRVDVLPVPRQVGQGSSMTVPLPPQRGQGSLNANEPTSRPRTPRPLHSGQSRGLVPGLAPLPLQSGHATGVSTWTGTWAPAIACSKDRLTSTSTSAPRRAGGPRPRAPPPREIGANRSAKSPNPAPPPPGQAP